MSRSHQAQCQPEENGWLDDVDDGRNFGRRGFVDAEDFPVQPDAQVALLLEEFEELRDGAFFDIARADGKRDEEGASGEAR